MRQEKTNDVCSSFAARVGRSISAIVTLCAVLLGGGVTAARAQALFVYRSGPVLSSFRIYPIYYGNWTDTTAHDTYIASLAAHISGQDSPTGQRPVIWQYGVTSATVAPSVKSKNPLISPVRKITRSDIPNIIHANQKSVAGAPPLLPAYAPGVLIVVFVSQDYGLDCGVGCGAYHSAEPATASSSIGYYAAVPQLGLSDFQYLTAHEIFEAATDPYVIGTDCGSGAPGTCDVAPAWQRSNGTRWDELADNCSYQYVSFGVSAQLMDNTRNGQCSPTAYINPSTIITGASSAPHSYRRSDDVHSMVFPATDGSIFDIYLPRGGSWKARSFSSLGMVMPPASAGRTAPFVQSGGVSTVVYRGYDSHIYALSGTGFTSWMYADLSVKAAAPAAGGDPAVYRRFDNVNSIVYRGLDGNIYEIYNSAGTWLSGNLTAATGAYAAAGDPAAYVRSDGVSSVVYRATNNHICELYLRPGSSWGWGDLVAQQNAPLAAGEPVPYVRNSNVNSIVYRGSDGHIHSLDLVGGSWTPTDLFQAVTPVTLGVTGTIKSGIQPAAGDPAAYRRYDGVDAVVYLGTNQRILEISWSAGAWHLTDLTGASGAPAAVAGPNAYRRFDNVNSVDFVGSDHHVYQIYRPASDTAWHSADLTALSGGPGAR